MNQFRFHATFLVLSLTLGAATPRALAIPKPQSILYEAYFLENQQDDYVRAKELYDAVLASGVEGSVRAAARAGSDRCRDHLAAKNFAALMPQDTLVYLEMNRPGRIVEKLAAMLGLTGRSMQEALAGRPETEAAAPFYVPKEITISPALLKALGSFGGAAAALTDLDFEGDVPPTGVMVIHHGDVRLMKGLLETAFQFFPTSKKIGNLPTFGTIVPGSAVRVSGVLTESLFIVGTDRALVEGVVERLTHPGGASLATREDLEAVFSHRSDGNLFAFCNLEEMFKLAKARVSEEDRRELETINAFVDLDSLRWATFSIGIDGGALGARFAVRLADNHRSIVYNLLRLPPMTRECLKNVPADAAAFVGIGLNPAWGQVAVSSGQGEATGTPAVTGLDIGREVFGNIREFCAFIIPGEMEHVGGRPHAPPIPHAAAVFAVNDVARSRALWHQILSLPGLVAGDEPIRPRNLKIGKTDVTSYAIPDFGKVYLAQLDDCVAVGLTRRALKAAIHARNTKRSILDDEIMGKVIAGMPQGSSFMIAGNLGRLAEVATGSGDPGVAMAARPAVQLCRNTVAWFGLGQAPNQFTLRGAVSGLPNLNEALQQFSGLINGAAGMVVGQAPAAEVVRRSARPLISPKPSEDDPHPAAEEVPGAL
ncbi:MAG: hypothetical protein ACE5E1_07655 [Phycisphaerae bacterium]